jgi:hypothetical protein
MLGVGSLCASVMTTLSARADIDFQLVEQGTLTSTEVVVGPGALFDIDLLATMIASGPGVAAELDSFAYRIEFPSEEFSLQTNVFGAPFDNTLAGDGGFNGSIPWAPPSLQITNAADSGSALDTPLIADIYRTTASQKGVPGTGDNLLLETLGLTAPTALGDYEIVLNMLEAADAMGAFHATDSGVNFVVHVVPEPASVLPLLCAVLLIRRCRL